MSEQSSNPVVAGIVGAGVISEIYLKNLTTRFDHLRVVGIADLIVERAQAQAKKYRVEAFSVDEVINHPEVELVVNLTIPAAHAEIALAAIEAGKSAYNEKPLAISREDGRKLLERAKEQGVLIGAAPDTFLGGGLQTARKAIDDGLIGTPVAASAYMLNRGMEHWHPDPSFFFQPGAGPLFDVGVYYVTALASILGPVRRVSSVGRASFPERTIGNGPKEGETIPVNTPTHIIAALEFESGVVGSLATSFDVWETNHATLVIYGSEGTLRLPDPNTFGGPVQLLKAGGKKWEDVPLAYGDTDNSRGIGVGDMAKALRNGGRHRASGELGYHVLDIMASVLESSVEGKHITVESSLERPDRLPEGEGASK